MYFLFPGVGVRVRRSPWITSAIRILLKEIGFKQFILDREKSSPMGRPSIRKKETATYVLARTWLGSEVSTLLFACQLLSTTLVYKKRGREYGFSFPLPKAPLSVS